MNDFGMPVHPVPYFPTMDEQALRRLADDIKQRGLLDPVVTHDGVLVDGRSRILACRLARVRPRTVEWRDIYRGKQAVAQWIWAAHTAPLPVDQYIAITVAQHGHAEREAAKRRQVASGARGKEGGRGHKKTQQERASARMQVRARFAQQLGVSEHMVQLALNLHRERPELLAAVAQGKVKLVTAAKQVRKPKPIPGPALG